MKPTVLRKERSTITVEQPDLLDNLIGKRSLEPVTENCKDNCSGNKNNSAICSPISCGANDCATSTSQRQWLCPDTVLKVQTGANRDCRCTSLMCENMLQTEQHYDDGISDFLCNDAMLNLRRQELLHRKWTERVYDPLQRSIKKQVNWCNLSQLLDHKRMIYDNYLERCNRKACCLQQGPPFLNSRSATCLAATPQPLRLVARVKELDDPLRQLRRKKIAEDGLSIQLQTGDSLSSAEIEKLRLPPVCLTPLSRDSITAEDWKMIEASQIKTGECIKSRNPNKNASHLSWVNYYVPCDPQVIDDEFRVRKGEYRPPRRAVAPYYIIDYCSAAAAI